MKIVKDQSNTVVYMFADGTPCEITANGMVTPDVIALDIKPETHTLEENIPAPDLYVGGALKYDNGWTISNQEAIDRKKQELAEQQIAAIVKAMEQLFDSTAQSRRYDNRTTCALRAGYAGPFQAEGIAFATWMDACNAMAYQMLAEVQAGTRPMPETVADALALLPAMQWPDA